MRNKVNTWPGRNGNTQGYPLSFTFCCGMVARHGGLPGVAPSRGLRGARRGEVHDGTQGCINTLSIWNTNRWRERERDGASRCGTVFRSLRSPRKPNAPSKPLSRRDVGRGKTRKVARRALPRSLDVKRQEEISIPVTTAAYLIGRLTAVITLVDWFSIYLLLHTSYRWIFFDKYWDVKYHFCAIVVFLYVWNVEI